MVGPVTQFTIAAAPLKRALSRRSGMPIPLVTQKFTRAAMPPATISHLKPTKSSELLAECRRQATQRLPEALAFVLTQADDALFELANNADSSARQNRYFDAMRELRLKREDVQKGFLRSFGRRFEETTARVRQGKGAVPVAHEGELSLVAIDDVELALAVMNFSESLRTRAREALFALDKRIGVLLGTPALADDDNPFGPKAIGDAFREACSVLEADVEAKLTLFKLFDRYASAAIAQLFDELNRLLVEADVLPEIGAGKPQGTAPRRRTRVIIESEDSSVEAAGDDVFSTLQQLMHGSPAPGGLGGGVTVRTPGGGGGGGGGFAAGGMAVPGAATPGAPGPGGSGGAGSRAGAALGGAGGDAGGGADGGAGGVSGGGGGGLAGAPLLEGLTFVQRGGGGGAVVPDGIGGLVAAVDPGQVSAGNVNVLHGLRDSGAFAQAGPNENLTLEIVSLLFDYILDDPAIPDALKALIGRLQIPVLKVALIDRDVFSKKQHPARRLLDELAAASVGWSEGLRQQDALFAKVEEVVHRIVEDFDDDVALFATVLEDFLAFLAAERAEAEARTEKSTRSLHTKERIVKAKLEVDDEINARFAEQDVREFISAFVLDYWRQLLILTLIESGRDSEAWSNQLEVLDNLLWSVQPKTTPEDRKALTARLPALVKGIKSGMRDLEMDPKTCSAFLSMLASVHVVSIKNMEESSIAERKLAEAEARIAEERARAEEAGEIDPASEEFIKKGLARIFDKQGVEEVELDIDFSLFETAGDDDDESEPEAASSNIMEFIELVGTLDLGDWIEFTGANGATTRGRFTWISPDTGRYLFTTREGHKALDTTMQDLAVEFQQGRASIIKTAPDPLFDRALGDLIEKLEAGGTLD